LMLKYFCDCSSYVANSWVSWDAGGRSGIAHSFVLNRSTWY
jgi:hypothetical protein